MKRQLFTLVLATFISALTFVGCSKNTDKPGNGRSSTKDKLVGSYKLQELTLVHQGGTADVLESMDACDRDNVYILKADMTSAVVDAGQQCDPASDETGTWSLPNDNTIVLSGTTLQIKSMTGNTLKLSTDYSGEGIEGKLNITYVKQ